MTALFSKPAGYYGIHGLQLSNLTLSQIFTTTGAVGDGQRPHHRQEIIMFSLSVDQDNGLGPFPTDECRNLASVVNIVTPLPPERFRDRRPGRAHLRAALVTEPKSQI